jgi:hypothetical protein
LSPLFEFGVFGRLPAGQASLKESKAEAGQAAQLKCVPRMLRSAVSAFTRVFDAL